ncbi:MAG TPA: NAD(+) diphosphatase [Dermatophilaceae bacterium]|nr:NAD(+) diphosphatase [Dermatophilaceae bacterium]
MAGSAWQATFPGESLLDRRPAERGDSTLPRLLAEPGTRLLDWRDGLARVDVGHEPQPEQAALAWRAATAADGGRLLLFLGRDRAGAGLLACVWPTGPTADRSGTPTADRSANASGDGSANASGEPVAVPSTPGWSATMGSEAAHGRPALSGHWASLREIGPHLESLDNAAFHTAQALARWHETHPRCPRCGAATAPVSGGWIRRCPADHADQRPRVDPAVIMAVVDRDDRLLLARAPTWPRNRVSVIAGFVEPGESLESAVVRETAEEVGVVVDEVTYRHSQPWPFPASLMFGFTARAPACRLRPDPAEIAEAGWWTADEVVSAVSTGARLVPGRLSLARRLIEDWLSQPLTPPVESTFGRR